MLKLWKSSDLSTETATLSTARKESTEVKLPERKSIRKLVLVGVLIYIVVGLLFASTLSALVERVAPMELYTGEVYCQYPGRTTNPEGGCDNTDPCDPAQAKPGGSGECVLEATHNYPQLPTAQYQPSIETAGK